MSKPTAAEKNAKVLSQLSEQPIGPTEIARRINEPWCVIDGYFAQSSAITPVLRRIGAVRHKGGLYTKPAA